MIISKIFMPEACSPETHKSNEISWDGVFAEHEPIPGDEREISRQIIRTRVHTYEQSIAFNAFQRSAATDAVRFPVCRLCHNGWYKIADRRCWKPIDYGRIQKRKGIEGWPDFGSMFSPP
jgi:hypothetical protein